MHLGRAAPVEVVIEGEVEGGNAFGHLWSAN